MKKRETKKQKEVKVLKELEYEYDRLARNIIHCAEEYVKDCLYTRTHSSESFIGDMNYSFEELRRSLDDKEDFTRDPIKYLKEKKARRIV